MELPNIVFHPLFVLLTLLLMASLVYIRFYVFLYREVSRELDEIKIELSESNLNFNQIQDTLNKERDDLVRFCKQFSQVHTKENPLPDSESGSGRT